MGYLDDGIEAATVRASGNAVYWYLSLLSDDIAREPPTPKAILDERLAGFEPALRAILSATNSDDMRFDELFERDALRTWGAGHVTLLGDAAHPLLPHTGQGAAQALEDAVALGLAVAGPGSVEQALRRYEGVRLRRTRTFVRLGPRIAQMDRKKVLSEELNALGNLEKVISLDAHRIKKDVTARAADVRGLLGRRGPQARQLLRKLVVDRLECEPFKEGSRRGYRLSGRGTYARLLPGGECATSIGGSKELRRVVALSLSFAIQALAAR